MKTDEFLGPDACLGYREDQNAGVPGDPREAQKRLMYRGWRPLPLQNSNSEHLEALKRRQGRWIVTWPLFRALLGAHNHSAGPIDRDFGGSETSTGPMDRDFYVLGSFLVLLGASWELFWLL